MTASGIENRRYARLPIELDFTLTLREVTYTGIIGNISLSGAYLAEITPPIDHNPVADQGELVLKTTNGQATVKCQIVYVGRTDDDHFPEGVGVVFCDPDEETTSIIWNISFDRLMN